ncbi:hypothetical protein ACSNOJ_33505 [Streptomyces sp. URMC 128]|uniref:hypothetical protein n=1 Tax=Streptomyces sp. URMC 128 TaxID=3423404 RepID=UPI003F1BF175
MSASPSACPARRSADAPSGYRPGSRAAAAAPLAAFGIVVAAKSPPRVEHHQHPMDADGFLLLVVAVFGVLFGIIEGPELGWASPPCC